MFLDEARIASGVHHPNVGPSARVPIAYAVVPSDPFAKKLVVNTVLATLNRPATDGLVLFPRGKDTALLLDTNIATAYASATAEPPSSSRAC